MTIAKDNNIDEMITRYLAGETSADEDSRILLWISQSDANRKRYNDLKKAFDLTTTHVEVSAVANPEIDVDQEWSRFQNTIAGKKKNATSHVFRCMAEGRRFRIAYRSDRSAPISSAEASTDHSRDGNGKNNHHASGWIHGFA